MGVCSSLFSNDRTLFLQSFFYFVRMFVETRTATMSKVLPVVVALAAMCVAGSMAGDVLVLTDSDFKSKLADHDLALVKFYAPWLVTFPRIMCLYGVFFNVVV